MNRSFFAFGIGVISYLALSTGCYGPRSGALSFEVRTALDSLAFSQAPVEVKYFGMVDQIYGLVNEAASFTTEEEAIAHIQAFLTNNDIALSTIYNEYDLWQKHLSDDDRMEFVMILLSREKAAKLGALAPRFRRRIDFNQDWAAVFDGLIAYVEMQK
ncbi:MAG: hypothetical protein AAFR61_05700 [Bacteroidota bacterium]